MRLALTHAAQLDGIDLIEVRALQARPTWGDFLTEGWGGGVLFDLGAHPLAIALLLAAPARPVEVRAVLEGADDHPVDEHAEVTLQLDTGAQAGSMASWRGAEHARVGRPGLLPRRRGAPRAGPPHRSSSATAPRCRLPARPTACRPPLVDLGYLGQLECVRAATSPRDAPRRSGPAFGRTVLDITCAAYASAAEGGAWVPLPFDGPPEPHAAPALAPLGSAGARRDEPRARASGASCGAACACCGGPSALQPRPFAVSLFGATLFGVMAVGGTVVLGRVTDDVLTPAFDGRGRAGGTIAIGAIAIVGGVAAADGRRGAAPLLRADGPAPHAGALVHRGSPTATSRVPLRWFDEHPAGELLAHADADASGPRWPCSRSRSRSAWW